MKRWLSLLGVAAGALGFAAALSAMYGAMRNLMTTFGGVCASGGPYAIAPGHDCSSGDSHTTLLTVAPLVGIATALILVSATAAWSANRASGLAPILFGATFATLGWNFIDLHLHPPAEMSSTSAWLFCGVLFWVMGAVPILFGIFSLRSYFFPRPDPGPKLATPMPALVRAVSIPGMTMPGMATPGLAPTTSSAPVRPVPGNAYLWLAVLVVGAVVGAWVGMGLV